MKAAVSVPDDLFRQADSAARRLGVSRSELCSKAIQKFLKQQSGDAITERLNEVYSRQTAEVDPALHRAQVRSLKKKVW